MGIHRVRARQRGGGELRSSQKCWLANSRAPWRAAGVALAVGDLHSGAPEAGACVLIADDLGAVPRQDSGSSGGVVGRLEAPVRWAWLGSATHSVTSSRFLHLSRTLFHMCKMKITVAAPS